MVEAAKAKSLVYEDFLEVSDGWKVAYKYKKGHGPLLIFLNGLGDDYSCWNSLIRSIRAPHTLQIDLRGQGRTLTEMHLSNPQIHCRFPFSTHADDVSLVLEHLKIKPPVRLVGFSYGGGVALDFASRWTDKTECLALIAPYVRRLDYAYPALKIQWGLAKTFGFIAGPFQEVFEKQYEQILTHYMHQRFRGRLNDKRLRSIAIELSHEIMKFSAFDVVNRLPDNSIYMLTSVKDTLVPHSLFGEFWKSLPEEKKGRWVSLKKGEHLLLEEEPETIRKWLIEVLESSS